MNASSRRGRDATQLGKRPVPEVAQHSDEDSHSFDDEDEAGRISVSDRCDEDEDEGGVDHGSCKVAVVRDGRGRFVRSDSSTTSTQRPVKKKKKLGDDSWVVKGPIPGGPLDGSVIPSFGGHVAA